MTTLYLDCEYNSFKGDLISMALVSECGKHEWYGVLHCEHPHPWVAKHVIPVLRLPPVSLRLFTDSLYAFLNKFEAIHIVADWPEDIAHFCNALITGPGERIGTPPLTMEVVRIDSYSEIPHNALFDARGIRKAMKKG